MQAKKDLEAKYGFAKKFAEASTEGLLKTRKAESSKQGSGRARMYFVLALNAELKKRGQSPSS